MDAVLRYEGVLSAHNLDNTKIHQNGFFWCLVLSSCMCTSACLCLRTRVWLSVLCYLLSSFFFFFCMENQHKQTREEWLAHLMLEVSLQGEVPLPTEHTIKNGEALHGSTGLPTCSCLQHQGLINDAKRCLKQELDWRAIDLKTQEIPCKSKIEHRFFSLSFPHEHSIWENPFYLFA